MFLIVNSAEQRFPTSELDNIGFRPFSYSPSSWVYLILILFLQSQYWVQADRSSSMLFSWVLDQARGVCGHFCWLLTPCSELPWVLSEWEKPRQPESFHFSELGSDMCLASCILWMLNVLQPTLHLKSTGGFPDDYKNSTVENSSRESIPYFCVRCNCLMFTNQNWFLSLVIALTGAKWATLLQKNEPFLHVSWFCITRYNSDHIGP